MLEKVEKKEFLEPTNNFIRLIQPFRLKLSFGIVGVNIKLINLAFSYEKQLFFKNTCMDIIQPVGLGCIRVFKPS
jgi:hypothetical protein